MIELFSTWLNRFDIKTLKRSLMDQNTAKSMRIYLSFKPIPYPYNDEPHDSEIVWGKIELSINSNSAQQSVKLVEIQWDIRTLLEWVTINKERILSEPIVEPLRTLSGSITQRVLAYYDTEMELDDNELELMFDYRQAHGLHFALRGTDVEDIYLGQMENGRYEISWFSEKTDYHYQIDMHAFIHDCVDLGNQIKGQL